MFDRLAVGTRNRLHLSDSVHPDHRLGDLVDDQEVGRIAQVVIGLHHHEFGIHLGVGEVPIGGRHADVRRHVAG
jgi:hypothetical protein